MILLHLFYSAVPRALDTPRVRIFARAFCVALFALVLASAVTRGDEAAPAQPESQSDDSHQGRGNVSIIHVPGAPASESTAPAGETTPAADAPSESTHTEAATATETETAPASAQPATDHAAESTAGDNSTHVEQPTAANAAHAEAPTPAPAETEPTPAAAPAHADTPAPAAVATHATPPLEPAKVPAPHGETPVAASSHASAQAHAPASTHGIAASPGGATSGRPDAIDDFAESGRRFWQAGDHAAAEIAFTRALTANVPVEKKRSLVLEMAGLYRGANQLTKAAAVLEKFVKTYPNDREVPQVLLQLGATYRDLGVYSMATARFFQVLNTTLRVSDEDIPEYRKLAMKARLEIAETYAVQGNLTEAEKYFSRLQLLDLEPADRERVLLRGAQMQYTLKQWLAAEKALAGFAAASPESPHLAEVRYMRAKALDELGRKQEAVDEVVALLQMPVTGDAEVARNTSYWKRRCANELANNFYEQGDFLGALAVYQALARASMDPTWRWPAIYQIGLCFERMDMPQRAAEAYDAILTPDTAPAAGAKLPESLVSLQDMARWRRSHLVWIEDKGKQLQSLAADKSAGS